MDQLCIAPECYSLPVEDASALYVAGKHNVPEGPGYFFRSQGVTTDGDHIYECVQCDAEVTVVSSMMGDLRVECQRCGLKMRFNPRQFGDSNGPQWGVHRILPSEPLEEVPPAFRT